MNFPEFMRPTTQFAWLTFRRLGRTPLLFIVIWLSTVWWGERLVFSNSVSSCHWEKWESWDTIARPHHVLLVADPQLVDPHTYPGRPWPLSTLTILYTDLYLRRSYRYLLDTLEPDSTLFLGDLFDGGREWGLATYKSPEQRYKKYGMKFWLKEYHRFMSIFVDGWAQSTMHEIPNDGGRRIVTSLPGNHDLGFAGGINSQVKSRFDSHFGPLNRIDMMGNHTFVSLDTVSLSAMDQVDSKTGSSGAGDGSAVITRRGAIWKPVEDFLRDAHTLRDQAARHYVRMLDSFKATPEVSPRNLRFTPAVYDAGDIPPDEKRTPVDSLHVSTSQLPTIVLSHVPLYRGEGADCGPLRERGRSLLLSGGYQYQNVLTPLISKDIIDHLDAGQITQIYSGDDHDYCEVEHDEFSGRIREITVKSISWAMGVRKPGVQLASLWNPIDIDQITTKPADADENAPGMPRKTVQNHLCLLPDQLSIFIRYAQLLGVTLVVLIVRAIRYKPSEIEELKHSSSSGKEKGEPLLPVTRKITPPGSPQCQHSSDHITSSSISSSTNANHNSTSSRLAAQKQSLGGYGNVPPSSRSHSPFKDNDSATMNGDTDDWGMPLGLKYSNATYAYNQAGAVTGANHRHRKHGQFSLIHRPPTKLGELLRSVVLVAVPVLGGYFWVIWNG